MAKQRRNRAKVLTPDALQQLKAMIRQHEWDENAASRYSLEKLGELTGLDPETVKKVLERQGADKRSLDRCFTVFGLTLTDEDYIRATQLTSPQIDPNFVGREEAIAHLKELVNRNAKVIVIQARGGVGKTTLARRFLSQEFDSVLEFPIAKETKDIASIESLLEEKLRQLGEEPGREFMVSCDRLKRKLQNERIGILIDNLEPALDSAGRFIERHRRYVEVLRILADPSVQSTTLITTRERLRESSITVEPYLLKSLDVDAWKEFFQSRNLATDTPALAALHNAYGGNVKAMEIISGAIAEDFDGDVKAYWQENQNDLFIERDLEDLVTQQFERLREQNPDAYNLLCRMGCYRYQDVPTVPIEGLFCLLWDVPENRYRRLIKALRERSLIEDEHGDYWLHPVIRFEAISCLRKTKFWEKANQKVAEFWSQIVKRAETEGDGLCLSKMWDRWRYHVIPKAGWPIQLVEQPCLWCGYVAISS
ncbi:MAG: ATP-binding protein [Cyanothece sp. SIO1E1]|nr:ATP-binding protein [Cyanothece sp. SIO1E1]